jgi:nucleoside-diphosphate-sugar epimerase
MRVLVTGGAGFIGSHLTAALLSPGYRVRALDNLCSGRRESVPPQAGFIEGDICGVAACDGVSGSFHMAAIIGSAASLNAIEVCAAANSAAARQTHRRAMVRVAEIPVTYRSFDNFTKPIWRRWRGVRNLLGTLL